MEDDYNLFKDDTETPIVSIFTNPCSSKKEGKRLRRQIENMGKNADNGISATNVYLEKGTQD